MKIKKSKIRNIISNILSENPRDIPRVRLPDTKGRIKTLKPARTGNEKISIFEVFNYVIIPDIGKEILFRYKILSIYAPSEETLAQ